MSEESIEMIRALYELKSEVVLNTSETKHLTEYFKNNGFAEKIVTSLTRRFAITFSIIGVALGILILIV